MRPAAARRARGAFLVEFAFTAMILIAIVLGLVTLGLALFKWNSAVEASRRGARTAAIVAMNDTDAILGEMRLVFPELEASAVTIEYSATLAFPGACAPGTCRYVRVGVDYVMPRYAFFLPAIAMPRFSTTYPVEVLGVAEPVG
jgi:Flp pilus assembly protein TadG